MDKSFYYTGTDYGSMHPWHWDFWFHMMLPWTWHNWVWLSMGILYIFVKLNDTLNINGE